jgi:hypothetical protein
MSISSEDDTISTDESDGETDSEHNVDMAMCIKAAEDAPDSVDLDCDGYGNEW